MKRTMLAAAVLAVLQANAQTPQPAAPAPQPAAPASPEERTLRPVVVTATPGVAQQAFDTAASIDVVEGTTIRNAQLQVNLSETLMRVPGVVALNRQNYAQDLQISIRGFGARSTFGVRGLRLYSDGIPATAPDGQGQVSHFDLSSADRIEVLRGPFSSLYGNSSGGVISIFTADGLPGQQVEGAATVGSDGIRRENLRYAGDIGAWNWNLNATHFETDGFREHSAAKRDGLNAKVKWKGSASTRVTFVANAVDMPDTQDPLGLTRAEFEADPTQASPAALQFNTRKSVDQQQLGVIIEHQLDPANALKLTTWRGQRSTEQFQAIPVGTQAPITHPGGVIDLARDYQGIDGQWVYSSRVLDNPLTVTFGLSGDELKEHRQGFLNFVGTTLGVKGAQRRDEDNRVRSFDQYAQANWDSERWGFTLGLRHSDVRFNSQDHFIVGTNPDDSGSADYAATTPMAAVIWHASDRLNLYASVGRGFETPTFNEVSYRPDGQTGLNFDLRAAYSRQYELGLKAEPVRNWRVNAALFQAKTSDEIVVLTNQGGRSTFQNASSTRRRGLEAALAGSWGDGWSTYAAFTWLDATYRADFFTCPAAPCPTAGNPAVLVPAGSRIPGIPRASAFAELVWRHRAWWGLETALELRHAGRIAVDDRNTDFAPAATLWNFRLALAQNVNRWTVREFVRVDNLTDRSYIGSVIVNEGNKRFFEPAPGRTWLVGASATYAF